MRLAAILLLPLLVVATLHVWFERTETERPMVLR
jgi:hypothetical protein